MIMYQPQPHTIILIISFVLIYLIILLRQAIKNYIDIYDVFMLSLVGIIPGVFILFPKAVVTISRYLDLGFPFLLLFGLLFAVIFIYVYHLLVQIKKIQSQNIKQIQEISILREKIDSIKSRKK